MEKIDRRSALGVLARWSAVSFIPLSWVAQGCAENQNPNLFREEYQKLLAEIVEIILPKTATSPGAKEAKVHYFIALIVEDCYEVERKDSIILGLNELLADGFLKLSAKNKYEVIAELDKEASSTTGDDRHYFADLKGLTQWGYFSSEPGVTKGLRYNPTPGEYKGCIPYKGEIAWY